MINGKLIVSLIVIRQLSEQENLFTWQTDCNFSVLQFLHPAGVKGREGTVDAKEEANTSA